MRAEPDLPKPATGLCTQQLHKLRVQLLENSVEQGSLHAIFDLQ